MFGEGLYFSRGFLGLTSLTAGSIIRAPAALMRINEDVLFSAGATSFVLGAGSLGIDGLGGIGIGGVIINITDDAIIVGKTFIVPPTGTLAVTGVASIINRSIIPPTGTLTITGRIPTLS